MMTAGLVGVVVMPVAAQSTRSARNADDSPRADIEAIELKLFSANQALLTDPSNPELLLQKGIHLSALGRLQPAFEVFEGLRQSFPDHPAPYANLASIYGRWGKFEEARQMLLKADSLQANKFQTQISLASVNLELALAALTKANRINPGDRSTELKLRALERYITDSNRASFPATAAFTVPAPVIDSNPRRIPSDMTASSGRLRTQEPVERKKDPKDRLTLSTTEDAPTGSSRITTAQDGSRGASTSSVRSASVSPGSGLRVAVAPDARKQDVIATTDRWAKAWANRSYAEYIGLYSAKFKPNDGIPMDTWARRKKALMEKASYIQVDVQISLVRFAGDIATVNMVQRYKSDQFTDTTKKILVLAEEDGGWRILRESSSN
jgi:tetratricopeptide (TPR) repeat protein